MWAWPTTTGSRCRAGISARSAPTRPQARAGSPQDQPLKMHSLLLATVLRSKGETTAPSGSGNLTQVVILFVSLISGW